MEKEGNLLQNDEKSGAEKSSYRKISPGEESRANNGRAEGSIFNEQVMEITSDNVKEALLENIDMMGTEEGVRELADKITKITYLNMSYAFMKTSKMMAFVIIEHEKKIAKLQDMCLKLEGIAEYYKKKNSDLLTETRIKLEEYQSAFRSQETDLMKVRTPAESYEYTLDRISKRFDLLEKSIDSISERPGNVNLSHLLPGRTRLADFKRGVSLNGVSSKYQVPHEEGYLIGSRPGAGGRDYLLSKKPVNLSSPVYGPTWLGEYLSEKKSPFGRPQNSGRQIEKRSVARVSFGPAVDNLSFAQSYENRYEDAVRKMDREFITLADEGVMSQRDSVSKADLKHPSYL